jgi:hypothetical protein
MRYFLLFLLFSFDVFSQTLDGIYYDWSVFILENAGEEKKCYIASFPKKSIGNYDTKHKDKNPREPYVLITRFQEKQVEEVSIYSGFEYKIGSNIYISVSGQQFTMHTKEDIAWTKTKEEDKGIINALLDSTTLKVRAESSKAEYVVDEYSLKGLTRAYRRMKELCK